MRVNTIFILIFSSLILVSFSSQHALGYGGAPQNNSANNYTVQINPDKESYILGDSIIFAGSVNKYDEERNLRISIFDSGKNLILTQKTPVSVDAKFSYNVPLNEKFLEGKYTVKAQYGNSKATVQSITFMINSDNLVTSSENSLSSTSIPSWIKSNAGWWAEGQIDDNSFVEGIQFMIKEGLMIIPVTEQNSVTSQDNEIPSWIKSNAGWWAEGQIDDNSFVEGIQFMIKEGLMRVSN